MTPVECVAKLDELGVARSVGRPKAMRILAEAGVACTKAVVEQAIRLRKASPATVRVPVGADGTVSSGVSESLDRIVEEGRNERAAWDGLAAVARRLAQALDQCEPREASGLAAQLRATLLELEQIPKVGGVGSGTPIDDLRESWSRPVLAIVGDEASA